MVRLPCRQHQRSRASKPLVLSLLVLSVLGAVSLLAPLPRVFAPAPGSRKPRKPGQQVSERASALGSRSAKAFRDTQQKPGLYQSPLASGLAGVLGGVLFVEGGLAPHEASGQETAGLVPSLLGLLSEHHGSAVEDLFLASTIFITAYCLVEMGAMQMLCSHWQARVHVACNALAALCSVYGILMERFFRESPDLWWAVLTPVLYGISNLTMRPLMASYTGPVAYARLFELGQSFTLSFQGIHLLAWSSLYPELYWAAMPFWYWSLKKLAEQVVYMLDLLPAGTDSQPRSGQVEAHRSRDPSWGAFGLELDALTVGFVVVNLAAAVVDNAYMGIYTLRGPEGFFEASRALDGGAGWGSDHLRTALVKPALGSLVLSMSVFVGTLCSRSRLPLEVGVPISAALSAVGPWVVFFWHRLVDPTEPWLPELLGQNWGFLTRGGL